MLVFEILTRYWQVKNFLSTLVSRILVGRSRNSANIGWDLHWVQPASWVRSNCPEHNVRYLWQVHLHVVMGGDADDIRASKDLTSINRFLINYKPWLNSPLIKKYYWLLIKKLFNFEVSYILVISLYLNIPNN